MKRIFEFIISIPCRLAGIAILLLDAIGIFIFVGIPVFMQMMINEVNVNDIKDIGDLYLHRCGTMDDALRDVSENSIASKIAALLVRIMFIGTSMLFGGLDCFELYHEMMYSKLEM